MAWRDEGEPSPLLIVVTTLVIAALVGPLRRQLQRVVDWSFYRSKYDATQTIAALNATLCDKVDLERLGDELLGAVDETLHPAHAMLWLRPAPVGGAPAEQQS